MNRDRMVWFGRYEGWIRLVARGVRDGDCQSMDKAARIFDIMLPDRCVVVPMPSHLGRAGNMRLVAESVCKLSHGGRVMRDLLRFDAHESSYDQKRDGFSPAPFRAWCDHVPLDKEVRDGGIWVIDNVICTGVTAGAALAALGQAGLGDLARVCTLALSSWR